MEAAVDNDRIKVLTRYGRRFNGKQELIRMIEGYIHYYNTRRVQRRLGILTPMEKYELYFAVAA